MRKTATVLPPIETRTPGERERHDAARHKGELQTLGRLLRFVFPYRSKLILILMLEIVTITIGAIEPWYAKYLIDDAFPNRNWHVVWVILGLIIGTDLVRQGTVILNSFLKQYMKLRIGLDLRHRLYRQLQCLSPTFFQSRPIGEHMYRTTTDADAVVELVINFIPSIWHNLFQFSLILAFTAVFDYRVTLIIALYLIPYTLINFRCSSARREVDRQERAAWAKRDAGLQEGVAGVMVIKAFGRRHHEVRRYMRRNLVAQRIGIKAYFIGLVQEQGLSKMLPWFKERILWGYFACRVIQGEMTLGMVLPMLAYTQRLGDPISDMINYFNQVRVSLIPAERLMQTLDVPPAVTIKPDARRLGTLEGRIVFDNVSFAYESGQSLLEHVSFTVEPGRKIAIVGPSGSGKSTLLSLLLRQFDPVGGSVRMDGCDLRDLHPESFQHQIGLVLQETYLFAGTVADNLRLTRPGATGVEIEAAAKQAEVHDWIMALTDGYHTNLKEGTRLSVGQKQRIGIARALLTSPRILVLDEPTSSLDSRTEEQITRTLRQASKGRTTFLVTHRLHTAMDADEILVVAGGRIVQRGVHSDLVTQPGVYRNLFYLHLGAEEPLPAAFIPA